MHLLALIPFLLLQPVPVLTTTIITTDNDNMEKVKPAEVRGDETGSVKISVFDHGDGGGNDASTEENREGSKPKKRAVRADWYSFQYRGTMYHIKMNSSLGETYKSLATKAEQRNFMIENGEAEPYICGSRLRAAR